MGDAEGHSTKFDVQAMCKQQTINSGSRAVQFYHFTFDLLQRHALTRLFEVTKLHFSPVLSNYHLRNKL